MDPDLQRRIEEARNAGYSDQEISAALGQPISAVTSGRPDVAPNVPVLTGPDRERLNREEAAERTRQAETSQPEKPFTTGMAAAALGGTILAWEGGKWILKRVIGGAPAATSPIAPPVMTPPAAPIATAPVTAPVTPPTSPILGPNGQPMVRPVMPTTPTMPASVPVAQAQPSLIDRTTNLMRQIAASKVVRAGGALAAGLTTPSNIGQDYPFPQTGRMRGMEINPLTGLPWTKEQLQAYNANPALFDSQLPPAQMPR